MPCDHCRRLGAVLRAASGAALPLSARQLCHKCVELPTGPARQEIAATSQNFQVARPETLNEALMRRNNSPHTEFRHGSRGSAAGKRQAGCERLSSCWRPAPLVHRLTSTAHHERPYEGQSIPACFCHRDGRAPSSSSQRKRARAVRCSDDRGWQHHRRRHRAQAHPARSGQQPARRGLCNGRPAAATGRHSSLPFNAVTIDVPSQQLAVQCLSGS